MREALRDAMAEEMRRDEAVLVMGEDVAVFSSALPSAGVEGQATSRPGTWRKSASKLCEWVGPSWWPPPPGIRTTIGTRAWPLNM